MKKYILFLIPLLFINTLYSQVLYEETFDNYTLGNLGTVPTGTIPGKGGWFTKAVTGSTQANSLFTIVNETNRGKVLDITAYSRYEGLYVFKPNLAQLIDIRSTGNDVIKFEIDYFTGSLSSVPYNHAEIWLLSEVDSMDYLINPDFLFRLSFNKQYGYITSQSRGGIDLQADPTKRDYLPFNTWIKLVVYLDYSNKKAYFEIPHLNKAVVGDFLKNSTSANLIQDFKPENIVLTAFMTVAPQDPLAVTSNRYDNIKVTALSSVPPEVINLSTNEVLSNSFNLYLNPASNVVNITNNENMLVNQVAIYDTAGKLINTQNFNEQIEIQLNVENLANGTYMLHLQTNEGTAVKKLVKK